MNYPVPHGRSHSDSGQHDPASGAGDSGTGSLARLAFPEHPFYLRERTYNSANDTQGFMRCATFSSAFYDNDEAHYQYHRAEVRRMWKLPVEDPK